MGLGSRLWTLLARGEAPERDPQQLVEVALVKVSEGPMLVAELRQQGIEAVGIESSDAVTRSLIHMQIMVRRSDLPAAEEILAHLL